MRRVSVLLVGATALVAACGEAQVDDAALLAEATEIEEPADVEGSDAFDEESVAEPDLSRTPSADEGSSASAPVMVGADRNAIGAQLIDADTPSATAQNPPAGSIGGAGASTEDAQVTTDGPGQFGSKVFTGGVDPEETVFYDETNEGYPAGEDGSTIFTSGNNNGIVNGAGPTVFNANEALSFGLDVLVLHFQNDAAGLNELLIDPYYTLDGQGPHVETPFSIDPSLIGLTLNEYKVVYDPQVQNFGEWANEDPARIAAILEQGWAPDGTEFIFDGSVVKPGNQGLLPGDKLIFVVDPIDQEIIALAGDS